MKITYNIYTDGSLTVLRNEMNTSSVSRSQAQEIHRTLADLGVNLTDKTPLPYSVPRLGIIITEFEVEP